MRACNPAILTQTKHKLFFAIEYFENMFWMADTSIKIRWFIIRQSLFDYKTIYAGATTFLIILRWMSWGWYWGSNRYAPALAGSDWVPSVMNQKIGITFLIHADWRPHRMLKGKLRPMHRRSYRKCPRMQPDDRELAADRVISTTNGVILLSPSDRSSVDRPFVQSIRRSVDQDHWSDQDRIGSRIRYLRTFGSGSKWKSRLGFKSCNLQSLSHQKHKIKLAIENHKDWLSGEHMKSLKLGSEYRDHPGLW